MLHLQLHQLDLKRRYAHIHLKLDDLHVVICLRYLRLGTLTLIFRDLRRDESIYSLIEITVHLVSLETLKRHICVLALTSIEAKADPLGLALPNPVP